MSKICDEGDRDQPVNPDFGEGLEVVLDGLIELIEPLDDPYTDKCYSDEDSIGHRLIIIYDWYPELDPWDQIRKKTNPIDRIKYDNDNSSMKDRSHQTQ